MKSLIGFLFVLLAFLPAHALTNVDRAEFKNQNALAQFNAGFESGAAGWACTPALTINTTAGSQFVANSKAFATWDSTSAGQSCYSTAVKVPTTGSCESVLTVRNGTGTGTHLFVAHDGTSTIMSRAIDNRTSAVPNRLVYPCPASGTVKIGLLSVAANEPAVDLDGAWTGAAASVVNAAFSQPTKSFVPSGTWTTNSTYTGVWWRVNDRYHFRVKVSLAGAPNSASLLFNYLAPGITVDTAKMLGTTANGSVPIAACKVIAAGGIRDADATYSGTSGTQIMVFAPYTTAAPSYGSYGNVTQAAPATFTSGDSVECASIDGVPVDGWTASDAVVADSQRPPRVITYLSGSGVYIPSPGTTSIEVILQGGGAGSGGGTGGGTGNTGGQTVFGTRTVSGGLGGSGTVGGAAGTTGGTLPAGAISLMPPGTCGNPGLSGAYTTGGAAGGGIFGGAGRSRENAASIASVANSGSGGAGGGSSSGSAYGAGGGGSGGCDRFILPSPSAAGYSWSVGGGGIASAPAGSVYAGQPGVAGFITIVEYFGATTALLANSISVGAQNGAHEYAAKFTCSSGSSIASASQSGTSIGNIASGFCTITFPSGMFSSAPMCSLTWESASAAFPVVNTVSSSSIAVGCFVQAGTACSTATGYLQCKALK